MNDFITPNGKLFFNYPSTSLYYYSHSLVYAPLKLCFILAPGQYEGFLIDLGISSSALNLLTEGTYFGMSKFFFPDRLLQKLKIKLRFHSFLPLIWYIFWDVKIFFFPIDLLQKLKIKLRFHSFLPLIYYKKLYNMYCSLQFNRLVLCPLTYGLCYLLQPSTLNAFGFPIFRYNFTSITLIH